MGSKPQTESHRCVNSSMSALSLARGVAFLFLIRSSKPMKLTPMLPLCAPHHVWSRSFVSDAVDIVNKNDTRRDNTEGQYVANRRESIARQILFAKPKRDQCLAETLNICPGQLEEDINVFT